MADEIEFRLAVPADADALSRFSCAERGQRHTSDVEELIRDDVASDVAGGSEQLRVVVALHHGEIVGVVAHSVDEIDGLGEVQYIHTLGVRPDYQRRLIGTILKQNVLDYAHHREALAYAVEHWPAVASMANPVGYLFRVGQSKVRVRKQPRFLRRAPIGIPDFEPGLPAALAALPDSQRSAVWLAHGCGWTHSEIAEVLDVSASTVATHVSRGLSRLRDEMGVVV